MAYKPLLSNLFTPSNGGTVNLKTGLNIINPSGALLNLTINLPSNPIDGEEVIVSTTQIITTLSIAGGTILNVVATLALGSFFGYIYSTSSAKWHRSR